MSRGRPKKVKVDPGKPENPVESKDLIPFKKGQVVCDMKIIGIDPDSDMAIHFVRAQRRDIVQMGEKGETILIPNAVIRDPLTKKAIWEERVHHMSLGDFQNMVNLRKQVQSEVEKDAGTTEKE